MQNLMNRDGQKKVFKVFTIVEKQNSEKGIWLQIGVGSNNRDESLSIKLDAFPVNGQLHIREAEPRIPETERTTNQSQNQSQRGWQRGGAQ